VMMDPEVVSRFEREARAAVRLRSEHVARILDVGRLDSGSPYIVMEYLEGQDLAGLLAQRGPLDLATACDYVIQACDAIAEAHALGIVHRDLKPGNLFLATTSHGQQTIKVLDFGISKSQAAGDQSMTRTQAVMGSPGYMSPEQMRSTKNVDGRSDVWALGVILYELVAGRAPFEADTFTALCVKIAMDPHPPLPAFPAALPPGFEAVVNGALEKDPARRFPTAGALAQALAPFASAAGRDRAHRLGAGGAVGVGGSAARAIVAGPVAETTLGGTAGQVGSGPGRRRSRALAAAGGVVVAAAAIGVAMAALRPTARAGAAQPGASVEPHGVATGSIADSSPPQSATAVALDAGVARELAAPASPIGVEASPSPRQVDAGAVHQAPPDAAPRPDDRPRPKDRGPQPAIDPYGSPD